MEDRMHGQNEPEAGAVQADSKPARFENNHRQAIGSRSTKAPDPPKKAVGPSATTSHMALYKARTLNPFGVQSNGIALKKTHQNQQTLNISKTKPAFNRPVADRQISSGDAASRLLPELKRKAGRDQGQTSISLKSTASSEVSSSGQLKLRKVGRQEFSQRSKTFVEAGAMKPRLKPMIIEEEHEVDHFSDSGRGGSQDSSDTKSPNTKQKYHGSVALRGKSSGYVAGSPDTQAKDKSSKPHFNKNAASYEDWKKKNGISQGQKVFIISGGLNDLKKGMLDRGWLENPDQNSPFYDFKWSIKSKDIIFSNMWDFQLVNHFTKNTLITTKSGLAKSLENVNTFHDVDSDSFFPRCFNLNEPEEIQDFEVEYRYSFALAVVRRYTLGLPLPVYEVLGTEEGKSKNKKAIPVNLKTAYAQGGGKPGNETFSVMARALVSFLATAKRSADIDDILDLDGIEFEPNISQAEWTIVKGNRITPASMKNFLACSRAIHNTIHGPQFMAEIDKWLQFHESYQEDLQGDDAVCNVQFSSVLKLAIEERFKIMKAKDRQFELYGKDHLWIMKPGTSSRGRGIEVFSSFDKLMDRRASNRDIPWIVQKYMENSLLVRGRKFDIRQWVLVTDWNPLTVWFYEDSYVRFSVQSYDPNDMSAFVHLTNNSISKHKKVDYESEEQKFFGKNMWSCDQFADHLKSTHGTDVYYEKIKPSIKDIVLWTMSSSQDMIENRKNSMELYGLDIMVDDEFNAYLIEVNSSPSMEHSTSVTSKLVSEMSEDVIKVTVDNQNGRKKNLSDTGKFTCLVRRKQPVPKPTFHMKFNMPVIGTKVTRLDLI